MSDKRAIIVESCKDCPKMFFVDPEDKVGHCFLTDIGKPIEDMTKIRLTCSLSKWPSVTRDDVFKMLKEHFYPSLVMVRIQQETDEVVNWLKSKGMEVRDAKD